MSSPLSPKLLTKPRCTDRLWWMFLSRMFFLYNDHLKRKDEGCGSSSDGANVAARGGGDPSWKQEEEVPDRPQERRRMKHTERGRQGKQQENRQPTHPTHTSSLRFDASSPPVSISRRCRSCLTFCSHLVSYYLSACVRPLPPPEVLSFTWRRNWPPQECFLFCFPLFDFSPSQIPERLTRTGTARGSSGPLTALLSALLSCSRLVPNAGGVCVHSTALLTH